MRVQEVSTEERWYWALDSEGTAVESVDAAAWADNESSAKVGEPRPPPTEKAQWSARRVALGPRATTAASLRHAVLSIGGASSATLFFSFACCFWLGHLYVAIARKAVSCTKEGPTSRPCVVFCLAKWPCLLRALL